MVSCFVNLIYIFDEFQFKIKYLYINLGRFKTYSLNTLYLRYIFNLLHCSYNIDFFGHLDVERVTYYWK